MRLSARASRPPWRGSQILAAPLLRRRSGRDREGPAPGRERGGLRLAGSTRGPVVVGLLVSLSRPAMSRRGSAGPGDGQGRPERAGASRRCSSSTTGRGGTRPTSRPSSASDQPSSRRQIREVLDMARCRSRQQCGNTTSRDRSSATTRSKRWTGETLPMMRSGGPGSCCSANRAWSEPTIRVSPDDASVRVRDSMTLGIFASGPVPPSYWQGLRRSGAPSRSSAASPSRARSSARASGPSIPKTPASGRPWRSRRA